MQDDHVHLNQAMSITAMWFAACSDHHDPAPVKSAAPLPSGSDVGSNGSNTGLKMNRTRAGTPDVNGWYPAHSDAGRFSVLMPAPFNDFSLDSVSEKGAPIVSDVIGTQKTDGVKFSVVCNRGGDLPPSDALRTIPDKMGVQAVHLSFKGHDAVEMHSLDPVGVMRAVALKNQLCLLIVDPQGPTKIVPDNEAKIMFESFTPDPVAH